MRTVSPEAWRWTGLLCSLVAFELPAQPQEPASTLDVEALEARGATIGEIDIRVDDVFDTSNPTEDKRLYRWANRVHVETRRSVVEDILLFDSGDVFEARLLEESARLLRRRDFVSDATITITGYDAETNTVSVDVWLRDSWSLEPDLRLSRGGGETEWGIGLTDDNLLGWGKALTVAYQSEIDRDSRIVAYSDSNLAGSRSRLNFGLADTTDGRSKQISAGRPFFSLDSRWSLQAQAYDDERIDKMYDLGVLVDDFRHDTRYRSVQGGRSRGLVDGMTRRWLLGLSYEEDLFEPSADRPVPVLLPEDRQLVYPWFGMHWLGDDYRELSELNDMGRTEDVALGLDLFVSIGFASKELGSDRAATLFNFSVQRGWEPGGPGRLFLIESQVSARREATGTRNGVVDFSGRYYHRNLGGQLFSASLRTVFTSRLDLENQVLLGGDNDLRGYPIRYQSGARSAILTIEQRFFTDWYAFRLVRVGYAFFLDAGRVWGDAPRGTPTLGTLYDVGVGLRLTSPRSSSRAVVHIDLAFPINAADDIDNVQLNIEKKLSF